MIYFIADESTNTVKIGVTKDVYKRLTALQTGHSTKLKLLHVTEGSYEEEKCLHKKYKKYKVRNEWFDLSDEIVNDIEYANFDEIIENVKNDPDYYKESTEDYICFDSSLETLSKFDNITQFKVLLLLFKFENPNSGFIVVNDIVKSDIADKIKLSVNSVTLAIKQSVDNDCLVRVKKGIYRINPNVVYKVDNIAMWRKRLIYEEIKQNKHDNN